MAIEIQFIEPMYALGVRTLPEGPDWLYEIKLDGYRCIVARRLAKNIRERVLEKQSNLPNDSHTDDKHEIMMTS